MKALEKFNVKINGKGSTPMIFSHGFGCDQSMWRFVSPAFESQFKTVLLDLMGSGLSASSLYTQEKYSNLQGYCDDIIEICEELQFKDVVFVGHSVSAMIGVLAAIQRPDLFSQLILVGPSPCYFNDGDYKGGFELKDLKAMMETVNQDFLSWARGMAPAVMGRPDRPELATELTHSFCKTDHTIAKNFAKVTFLTDVRSELSKLKTPSLILQCSQDIVAPETVGQYLHKTLNQSAYHKLDAVGHCPHVSEPEETIQAIKKYLEKTQARKAA